MSTVAEQLRVAREAKKYTVEEVADLTKIRTDHVRALEAGQFNVFSATIYIRGSVKIYGNLLKLDVPLLLTALDMELKGTERFSEPPPLSEPAKKPLDNFLYLLSKVNVKVILIAAAVLILILIFSLISWAWRSHKKSDPLANLPPAVYQPANSSDTLPLPKH